MEPWVSQQQVSFSLALGAPGPPRAPVPAGQILSGPFN